MLHFSKEAQISGLQHLLGANMCIAGMCLRDSLCSCLTRTRMSLISLGAGVLMNSLDFCIFAFEEGRKGLLGNDWVMLGKQG